MKNRQKKAPDSITPPTAFEYLKQLKYLKYLKYLKHP